MTAKTLAVTNILGGRRVLGRRVSSWGDLVTRIRVGLPYNSLESVMGTLGISRDEVSTSLALPRRTLARRKKEARLHADESDRVFRLARIAALAVDVLGTKEKAARWLHQPNRALGNEIPLSQLDTDIGARHVETVLGRIEHGVFS